MRTARRQGHYNTQGQENHAGGTGASRAARTGRAPWIRIKGRASVGARFPDLERAGRAGTCRQSVSINNLLFRTARASKSLHVQLSLPKSFLVELLFFIWRQISRFEWSQRPRPTRGTFCHEEDPR